MTKKFKNIRLLLFLVLKIIILKKRYQLLTTPYNSLRSLTSINLGYIKGIWFILFNFYLTFYQLLEQKILLRYWLKRKRAKKEVYELMFEFFTRTSYPVWLPSKMFRPRFYSFVSSYKFSNKINSFHFIYLLTKPEYFIYLYGFSLFFIIKPPSWCYHNKLQSGLDYTSFKNLFCLELASRYNVFFNIRKFSSILPIKSHIVCIYYSMKLFKSNYDRITRYISCFLWFKQVILLKQDGNSWSGLVKPTISYYFFFSRRYFYYFTLVKYVQLFHSSFLFLSSVSGYVNIKNILELRFSNIERFSFLLSAYSFYSVFFTRIKHSNIKKINLVFSRLPFYDLVRRFSQNTVYYISLSKNYYYIYIYNFYCLFRFYALNVTKAKVYVMFSFLNDIEYLYMFKVVPVNVYYFDSLSRKNSKLVIMGNNDVVYNLPILLFNMQIGYVLNCSVRGVLYNRGINSWVFEYVLINLLIYKKYFSGYIKNEILLFFFKYYSITVGLFLGRVFGFGFPKSVVGKLVSKTLRFLNGSKFLNLKMVRTRFNEIFFILGFSRFSLSKVITSLAKIYIIFNIFCLNVVSFLQIKRTRLFWSRKKGFKALVMRKLFIKWYIFLLRKLWSNSTYNWLFARYSSSYVRKTAFLEFSMEYIFFFNFFNRPGFKTKQEYLQAINFKAIYGYLYLSTLPLFFKNFLTFLSKSKDLHSSFFISKVIFTQSFSFFSHRGGTQYMFSRKLEHFRRKYGYLKVFYSFLSYVAISYFDLIRNLPSSMLCDWAFFKFRSIFTPLLSNFNLKFYKMVSSIYSVKFLSRVIYYRITKNQDLLFWNFSILTKKFDVLAKIRYFYTGDCSSRKLSSVFAYTDLWGITIVKSLYLFLYKYYFQLLFVVYSYQYISKLDLYIFNCVNRYKTVGLNIFKTSYITFKYFVDFFYYYCFFFLPLKWESSNYVSTFVFMVKNMCFFFFTRREILTLVNNYTFENSFTSIYSDLLPVRLNRSIIASHVGSLCWRFKSTNFFKIVFMRNTLYSFFAVNFNFYEKIKYNSFFNYFNYFNYLHFFQTFLKLFFVLVHGLIKQLVNRVKVYFRRNRYEI